MVNPKIDIDERNDLDTLSDDELTANDNGCDHTYDPETDAENDGVTVPSARRFNESEREALD